MRWAGRQYSQQGLAGQGSQGQWERRDKQLLWAKIINDKKSGKNQIKEKHTESCTIKVNIVLYILISGKIIKVLL